MKRKQRIAALLLALIFTLTAVQSIAYAAGGNEGNSAMSEEEILALLNEGQDLDTPTAISRDRAQGIVQVRTVIPDYNFAAAVYDALYADNHLGTEGQDVKEVLSSFTGKIDANGYAKKTTYKASVVKIDTNTFDSETITQDFSNQEDAQAWLESFQSDGQFNYPEKNKKIEVITTQTTEQKPDSELIHSIEGIIWLRQADEIDISFNAISDFMPLSKAAIEEAMAELGEYDEHDYKKWFGEPSRNTKIDLTENPMAEYPEECGGRLIFANLNHHQFSRKDIPIIVIKPQETTPNWSTTLDIDVPVVKVDGTKVTLSYGPSRTHLVNADGTGAELVDSQSNDDVLHTTGIAHSGKILFEILLENKIEYTFGHYTVVDGGSDNPTAAGSVPQFKFLQPIRIYLEANPDTPEVSTTIKLNKIVKETEHTPARPEPESIVTRTAPLPAPDCKFQLYTATLAGGQYTKGAPYLGADGQPVICTTDQNGQFTFSASLPVGDYCFVEIEAAPGLMLDDTTVYGFSVGSGGTLAITGGDQTIEPSDGSGPITAEEGSTFIDRYSPDVDVEVTPDQGMTLDKIIITYFDRETQANKTLEVAAAQAAANWINENKGDEDNVGVIDGTVTLKPIFTQAVQFEAENAPIPDPDPDPKPEDKTGSLTVSKTVSGDGADTTKEFTFTVTLEDKSVTGAYGGMTFENGVATFKLAHGQSATATGLPADVDYTVTEDEANQDGYTTTATGDTGTIEADQTATVTFTNTKDREEPDPGPDPGPDPEDKTGGLTVSKTVSGSGASTTKEFTFTVTLEDKSITGTYGGMMFENGVATFKLAHGQSVTATGLPAGIKYTVAESDNSGYSVTSTGETGTIPEGQKATAAFDNYKSGGGSSGGNDYTSLTVKKVWKLDDGGSAPDKITVALMRDGKQYKTVELNEDNGWQYTWNRLNDRYTWTVEELDVPDGFTVSMDKKGTVITITNDDRPSDPGEPPTPDEPDEPTDPDKPVPPDDPDIPDEPGEPDIPTIPEEPDEPDNSTIPEEPDEPGLPQTGQLWWPVVLLVVMGAVLVVAGVFPKKKYHGKHEA